MISIGNYSMAGLKIDNITLPVNFASLGSNAFNGCTNLTTVVSLNPTPPSLDSFSFNNCTKLANIYVPSASVNAYKTATNWSAYANIIEAIPE